jgi:hypothetical protein
MSGLPNNSGIRDNRKRGIVADYYLYGLTPEEIRLVSDSTAK